MISGPPFHVLFLSCALPPHTHLKRRPIGLSCQENDYFRGEHFGLVTQSLITILVINDNCMIVFKVDCFVVRYYELDGTRGFRKAVSFSCKLTVN